MLKDPPCPEEALPSEHSSSGRGPAHLLNPLGSAQARGAVPLARSVLRAACRLLWLSPVLLGAAAAQTTLPPFSHVFVLVLENISAGGVLGNPNLPTLNALAREYGLATNYTGVAHPSLPNYVALLFGSTPSAAAATTPASVSPGTTSPCNWSARGRPGRATSRDCPAPAGTVPRRAPTPRSTTP